MHNNVLIWQQTETTFEKENDIKIDHVVKSLKQIKTLIMGQIAE